MRRFSSERTGRLAGDPAYPEVTGWRDVDERAARIEVETMQRAIREDAGLCAVIEDVSELRPAARSALARALSSLVTA